MCVPLSPSLCSRRRSRQRSTTAPQHGQSTKMPRCCWFTFGICCYPSHLLQWRVLPPLFATDFSGQLITSRRLPQLNFCLQHGQYRTQELLGVQIVRRQQGIGLPLAFWQLCASFRSCGIDLFVRRLQFLKALRFCSPSSSPSLLGRWTPPKRLRLKMVSKKRTLLQLGNLRSAWRNAPRSYGSYQQLLDDSCRVHVAIVTLLTLR